MLTEEQQARLGAFVEEAAAWPYFANAGRAHGTARVATDLSDALDGYWDCWGPKSADRFAEARLALEAAARATIGDDGIDAIFARVGEALDEPVSQALGRHVQTLDDEDGVYAALAIDLFARAMSDLAWAAVEAVIVRPWVFGEVADAARAGRWLCGWEDGRQVVI